jgi:hypothetical protein
LKDSVVANTPDRGSTSNHSDKKQQSRFYQPRAVNPINAARGVGDCAFAVDRHIGVSVFAVRSVLREVVVHRVRLAGSTAALRLLESQLCLGDTSVTSQVQEQLSVDGKHAGDWLREVSPEHVMGWLRIGLTGIDAPERLFQDLITGCLLTVGDHVPVDTGVLTAPRATCGRSSG